MISYYIHAHHANAVTFPFEFVQIPKLYHLSKYVDGSLYNHWISILRQPVERKRLFKLEYVTGRVTDEPQILPRVCTETN